MTMPARDVLHLWWDALSSRRPGWIALACGHNNADLIISRGQAWLERRATGISRWMDSGMLGLPEADP